MTEPRYIGLDWGTSSLRAYLFSAQGKILEQRAADWGIMNLPGAPAGEDNSRASRFRRAFWGLADDWLKQPGTSRRVVACGMVGSAQGWREAPYISLPVRIEDISGALVEVDAGDGVVLAIAPGLMEHSALPNVLRGEETQIAGALAMLNEAGREMSGRCLLGLPGTHSKWAYIRDGNIEHFDTFMTGEVYALLVQHSVLGRTMAVGELAPESDEAVHAFLLGVDNARSSDGARGLLATLFSSRTLGLSGALTPAAQHEYLSGVLLGHEVRGLVAGLPAQWQQASIILLGRPGLCLHYQRALGRFGLEAEILSEDAGLYGLWAWVQADQRGQGVADAAGPSVSGNAP